tara:strand:- start:862 stop:2754 length:1893 start_codon:yes stop_codon:yes gene_type:complete
MNNTNGSEIVDEGIVENTRKYIFDPRNNLPPHEIENLTPYMQKQKTIETLEEKGHFREIEGEIGPLQNIIRSPPHGLSSKTKLCRRLYLFLDVNFSIAKGDEPIKSYESSFKDLVQDRIQRASWNTDESDYDIELRTLSEDADVSSEQWRSITMRLADLTPGSRLFVFDNKEEINDVNDVEDLLLSNHIKLRELNDKIGVKHGPLEMLGLFSNSLQQAFSNPEMFREFKEKVEGKTEVIILPTSLKPMNTKLHFERAGIIEALVASHKIGGEYVEWIDSCLEKVFKRINSHEKPFTKKHVAISTSTFVSKIFSSPSREKKPVNLDSEPLGKNRIQCSISKINSVIMAEGHERLNYSCCSDIQKAITELVHRSMTYINTLFEKESQFRAIIFASVINMNEEIRGSLHKGPENELTSESKNTTVESRIKQMWSNLSSLDSKNICGIQTMTAKHQKWQTREGAILNGWKETCKSWEFKARSKSSRQIKQILGMILEDDADIEQIIKDWKGFLEQFKKSEVREKKYGYGALSEVPKYGLFLLSQGVCEPLRELFAETKKVTHGDLFLLNKIPGMDLNFRRLYIDIKDKRYIPASKAYEIIKKLNDALIDCNWENDESEEISIDPSTEPLEWWSD